MDPLEKFGLTRKDREIIVGCIRRHLQRNQHATLWLFGSRANGTFRKHSDVDLLLSDDAAITIEQIAAMKSDLEESNLPIRVDLVLDRDLYPPYRAQFEQEKVKLENF